jgi:hypothetical protein
MGDIFQEQFIRTKIYRSGITWFLYPEYQHCEDSKVLIQHVEILKQFYSAIEVDKLEFQNTFSSNKTSATLPPLLHSTEHHRDLSIQFLTNLRKTHSSFARAIGVIVQEFSRHHMLLSAFLQQEIERLLVWMDPLGSMSRDTTSMTVWGQKLLVKKAKIREWLFPFAYTNYVSCF